MRLLYGGWGAGYEILCVGYGGGCTCVYITYMGVYGYIHTLPYQYMRDLVPQSNNPAPHPPYKRRMPTVTAYVCFLLIHPPEDGHKRRNM